MSNKAVEELEKFLHDNAEDYLIHDRIDRYILNTSSKFFLYFFRKCSEQFLACQDNAHSSIIHGLVKSQMSSSNKMKSLKMLLIRNVNCNKPDGTGKFVLDYLIEDNDYECIEVLLQYGQDLKVSEKCLSKVFQLRNKHEEAFRLLFAYAIKHKVAPHLIGLSDGDTFLHEIMLYEKEKALFKKWMGYFLSFSEVSIDAVNNNGFKAFDLLFLNYEKKRCKCAIKLLIKYRFPNISNYNCLKLEMFSLTISQQFKKDVFNYFKKAFLNKNKNTSTTDNEFSIIVSEKYFSHKYLKLKQTALWSSTKSLKKSSQNSSPLNLPNHEETEMLFEIETSGKAHRENKIRSSQKSITETAKAKKYLSSKEAVAYRNLIGGKNSKMPFFCTPATSESNSSGCTEEIRRDLVSNSILFQRLLQESTLLSSVKNLWNNELLGQNCCIVKLSLGQESYGIVYDAVCNGPPCVTKAVSPCIAEKSKISTLNHPNVVACDNAEILNEIHHFIANISHKKCLRTVNSVIGNLNLTQLNEDPIARPQLSINAQKNISVPQGILQSTTVNENIFEITIVGLFVEFYISKIKNLQQFPLPSELMNLYLHGLVCLVINYTANHFYKEEIFVYSTETFKNCVQLLKVDIHENTDKMAASESVSSYGLWQLINNMDSTFHKMISMLQELNISGGLKGCIVVLQSDMCLIPFHALLDRQNGLFNKVTLPQIKLAHLDQKINKTETKEPTQQDTFPLLYKNSLQNYHASLQFLKDIYKDKFKSLGANLKGVPGKHKIQVSVEIGPDPEASFSGLFDLIHGVWQYITDADNADNYSQLVHDIIIAHIVQQFRMNQCTLVSKDVMYLVLALLVGYGYFFKNKCELKTIPLNSCLLDMNRNKVHIKELNISSKNSNNCYPTISSLDSFIQYLKSLLDTEREARFIGNYLRITYVLRELVTKKSVLHKIKSAHLTAHGSSSAFTHASKKDIPEWKNMALAGKIKESSIVKELSGCSLHKTQKGMCLLIFNLANFQSIQRTLQSMRYLSEDHFDFSGYQFIEKEKIFTVQFLFMKKLSGKVPAFLGLLFEEYVLQSKKLPSLQNKALVLIDELDYHDLTTIIGVLSTNTEVKFCDFEIADKVSRNIIELHGNFLHIPPLCNSKKLDTFSFGCITFQIIKQKLPAINITQFCSKLPEIDEFFEKITPDDSVNRVGVYESHCISCLETSFKFSMKNEMLYNSMTQSCHYQSVEEYNSLLNLQLIHFLVLMHYLKFVPAFNWQMCESAYQSPYETIQKRMIFYFYTIYKHLCKRVLLRRKWVFFELPPIPLVIILTNKSLLHESKLVNLLQHDLTSIDLFAKALLKNIGNKNYIPLQLWTIIYEFCIVAHSTNKTVNHFKWVNKKEQEIKNIKTKHVSIDKNKCSCYVVEKLPTENSTSCYINYNNSISDDINNHNNGSIRTILLQSTNYNNVEASCEMMDDTAISLNQKVKFNSVCESNNTVILPQDFTNFCTADITCNTKLNVDYTITDEVQKTLNEDIPNGTEMINSINFFLHSNIRNLLLQEHCLLQHANCHCMNFIAKQTQESNTAISTETESEDKYNPVSYDWQNSNIK